MSLRCRLPRPRTGQRVFSSSVVARVCYRARGRSGGALAQAPTRGGLPARLRSGGRVGLTIS
eukprot:10698364-Alexandrium_andersonii.AAC.1